MSSYLHVLVYQKSKIENLFHFIFTMRKDEQNIKHFFHENLSKKNKTILLLTVDKSY